MNFKNPKTILLYRQTGRRTENKIKMQVEPWVGVTGGVVKKNIIRKKV